MSTVLIIGGGFAGVWAAAAAVLARQEAGADEHAVEIRLIDAGDDLVIRPRLYEADPQSKRVPLDRVLGPIGVRRVAATVTGIDTDTNGVTAIGRDGSRTTLSYDRLVLAAGSRVARPTLPGAEHLFDVDTMPAAAALESHLHRSRDTTVVIVGGVEVRTGVSLQSLDREQAVLSDGVGRRRALPGRRCRGRLCRGRRRRGDHAGRACRHAELPFAPDPYVTCLDLGSYGAVLTTGWDREIAMTGAEAKELKTTINSKWIYPPLDDAETIVRLADHRTTWPTDSL